MDNENFIIKLVDRDSKKLFTYTICTCCFMHAVVMAEALHKEGVPSTTLHQTKIWPNRWT